MNLVVTVRGPTNLRMRFRHGLVGPKGDPGNLTPANLVAAIDAMIAAGQISTARPVTAGHLYLNGDPVNGYALWISGTAP